MKKLSASWSVGPTLVSACLLSACVPSDHKTTAQAEAATDAAAAIAANNTTVVQPHAYTTEEYLVMHPNPTQTPFIPLAVQPKFDPAQAAAAKGPNPAQLVAMAHLHHMGPAPNPKP